MKILALEFSSSQRSVAVADAGRVCSEVIETGGRGTNALGMIESALREAGLEREQIECMTVGLGPGSYTGIRAAISVAQGWQLARRVTIAGVSSADCLAAQAQTDGLAGKIHVVIDAQRGEIYVAGYEVGSGGWRECEPLRLAHPDAVDELRQPGSVVIGPEATRWFPAGKNVYPRAAVLAAVVATAKTVVQGQNIEPIYLRETTFVKAPPPRVF